MVYLKNLETIGKHLSWYFHGLLVCWRENCVECDDNENVVDLCQGWNSGWAEENLHLYHLHPHCLGDRN